MAPIVNLPIAGCNCIFSITNSANMWFNFLKLVNQLTKAWAELVKNC